MPDQLSRTAMYVALYRALETVDAAGRPLFRDPFAARFLPLRLRAAAWAARLPAIHRWLSRTLDRRAPGARASAIGRTRYIDDVVRGCVAQGIDQVVVLGAGLDCRAHRMDELLECRIFEVDRRGMQEFKRSRLPRGPDHVHYLCVDFLKDNAFAHLRQAGWSERERTLFIWEGVTGYLTEKAVAEVLVHVGRTVPGTMIVFTYLHRGLLDGTARFEGADRMLRNVRALGEPWTFGLAPAEVGPFVGRFGLSLREDLGADEYCARYPEKSMRGYAFYRIAVAEVRGSG